MNVTPVIAIHIPFGGDNHRDVGLAAETTQSVAGVASIASLMAQLASAGLSDRVTFLSLNVFGRTMGPGNTDGSSHNPNHQVSITIGKAFKGGIVGGIGKVQSDYGALAIDSKSGKGSASGDIAPVDTLPPSARRCSARSASTPPRSGRTSWPGRSCRPRYLSDLEPMRIRTWAHSRARPTVAAALALVPLCAAAIGACGRTDSGSGATLENDGSAGDAAAPNRIFVTSTVYPNLGRKPGSRTLPELSEMAARDHEALKLRKTP